MGKRDFGHAVVEIKSIVTRSGNQMVRVGCWSGSKKAKAVVQSICTEIKNLVVGVTRGFRFEMKFVYAHFPINCNIANDKDTIVITGIDLDHVSQAAASIQQKCQVKNKDIRKFLDGVYVSKRDHIWDEED